jgi:hypothetical protein
MSLPLIAALIGFLGALIGAGLTAWFVQRRERQQRQLAFLERQLREFYSPMVGLRAEVRMRGELRLRIQNLAEAVSSELLRNSPDQTREYTQHLLEQFRGVIKDDNTTFKTQLIPAYQKMASLFREQLWLADPETQAYYPDFMEYLDVLERHLRDAIPGEVVASLGHTEANLHPFYAHLEARHHQLRAVVSSGQYLRIRRDLPA